MWVRIVGLSGVSRSLEDTVTWDLPVSWYHTYLSFSLMGGALLSATSSTSTRARLMQLPP
jgi:hypothetical protein